MEYRSGTQEAFAERDREAQNPAAAPQRSTSASRYDLTMTNGDVALTRYLRDIGRMSLLSAEEEIELGRRVQNGHAGARERMIQANLRLVVTIARDYTNLGVPLLDLISEGNIGLMNAVDRFDPDKGAKLSTYAAWWIKQSIKSALSKQSRTIRLPAQMADKISRFRRASAQLSNDLGREANEDELGEELGIASKSIAELKCIGQRPLSLDAPIDDEKHATLSEIIPDEQSLTSFQALWKQETSEHLDRVLRALSKREGTIIAHRFGLNGVTAKPLQQVAEMIGVTRERVRQLEIAALEKLRCAFKKHLGQKHPGQISSALLAAA